MALNCWLPNIKVYKHNRKDFYSLKMSIIEPYRIIGQEIANIEIGTIQKPKFYKITSGQRQKNSLLFHAKMLRIITQF